VDVFDAMNEVKKYICLRVSINDDHHTKIQERCQQVKDGIYYVLQKQAKESPTIIFAFLQKKTIP